MKRSRIVAIGIGAVLVLVVMIFGAGVLIKTRTQEFFYPTAPPMPSVVAAPMAGVLEKLEEVLKAKAPQVLQSLQPGLSAGRIAELESQSGTQLPEEIKALYQWRNGAPWPTNGTEIDFIPIHHFLSLEDALREKALLQDQMSKGTTIQRGAASIFTAHRDSWISLFSDGAGDGYYFDPKRRPSQGAVFYSFAEDAAYVFFPSVKNLLAAITKCYEQGVYVVKQGPDGPELDENHDSAVKILDEFGASNYPHPE